MVTLHDAQAPKGVRLYVIGDVHGCMRPLRDIAEWLEDDLNHRPPRDWRIVYLGDYIDRGPDSRGVIDFVISQMSARRVYALRGNHDQFMIDFLGGESTAASFQTWMDNGGILTLASYGIDLDDIYDAVDEASRADLREALIEALPDSHGRFLAGLPHMVRLGDYVFVHAGVRPGTRLDKQRAADLIWIREPFLDSEEDHGAVVVHGHTVSEHVQMRHNRIGIDTGAVFGGRLSCLVLEGDSQALLGPEGPDPLPSLMPPRRLR